MIPAPNPSTTVMTAVVTSADRSRNPHRDGGHNAVRWSVTHFGRRIPAPSVLDCAVMSRLSTSTLSMIALGSSASLSA